MADIKPEVYLAILKFAVEVSVTVFVGFKTAAIGTGSGINLPGVLSLIALVMSSGVTLLTGYRVLKLAGGADEEDERAKPGAARVRNLRNSLTAFILLNCAFQVGYNVDGTDSESGIIKQGSLVALGLAALNKIVLDPLADLGGFGKLFDVHCVEGQDRNIKRLLVLVALGAALTMLVVDIDEKGGLPGDYSDDHVAVLGTSLGLISLHLLLLLLGMVGQQFKACKALALGSTIKGGDCDEEKSSFHGLNEIPIVRSVVVGSVVILLSFILGEEVVAVKNAGTLAGSLISVMIADSLGRNLV